MAYSLKLTQHCFRFFLAGIAKATTTLFCLLPEPWLWCLRPRRGARTTCWQSPSLPGCETPENEDNNGLTWHFEGTVAWDCFYPVQSLLDMKKGSKIFSFWLTILGPSLHMYLRSCTNFNYKVATFIRRIKCAYFHRAYSETSSWLKKPL